MVALDQTSKTEEAIYALHESRPDLARPHLGGSEIGESCERRLWYSFRWASREKIPGRIMRLFGTGHREEARIIAELQDIGCEVLTHDPATGEQYRYSTHGGHFSGGLDGIIHGLPDAPKTWHLLEIKTHNEKSHKHLRAHGVQKSKPKHYAQMQTYMRRAKLKRAVYIAVCKNDDRIYVERIKYDDKFAQASDNKALRIIEAQNPLGKISDDPSYYECKFCPSHGLCHEGKVAAVNCRTCLHSTPMKDGDQVWHCKRYNCEIPEDKQRTGCESHLHIPDLIPFADPVDAGEDWVEYQNDGGTRFFECAPEGFPGSTQPHYSSSELAVMNPKAIGDPAVDAAKRILGGRIVG